MKKSTKHIELAEKTVLELNLKELTEVLIRQAGLHEGAYELGFNIKIATGSVGPNDSELPGAAIGIGGVFLIRSTGKGSKGTVDAAEANPKPIGTQKPRTRRAQKIEPT